MNSLARYHIYFNRHFTPQELIAMLESVTAEEMQEIAREFFLRSAWPPAWSAPSTAFELTRDN